MALLRCANSVWHRVARCKLAGPLAHVVVYVCDCVCAYVKIIVCESVCMWSYVSLSNLCKVVHAHPMRYWMRVYIVCTYKRFVCVIVSLHVTVFVWGMFVNVCCFITIRKRGCVCVCVFSCSEPVPVRLSMQLNDCAYKGRSTHMTQ